MNQANMKPKYYRKMWFRIAFGISIPLAIILGGLYLYIQRSFIPCSFYVLSRLYCPGCGSGRATVDLLYLRPIEAVHHNILFVLVLPFLVYYGIKVYFNIILAKDVLPFFKITPIGGIIAFFVIVFYWILRNIPVFPFNWLAP